MNTNAINASLPSIIQLKSLLTGLCRDHKGEGSRDDITVFFVGGCWEHNYNYKDTYVQ